MLGGRCGFEDEDDDEDEDDKDTFAQCSLSSHRITLFQNRRRCRFTDFCSRPAAHLETIRRRQPPIRRQSRETENRAYSKGDAKIRYRIQPMITSEKRCQV